MKLLLVFLSIFAMLAAIFFVLNTYIDTEKQGNAHLFSDGEHLGFIHALTDNNTGMDFDDAVWLTGRAAQDAAIRAELCTEETRTDCTPNDFFIENSGEKDERITIDPNVHVYMQTWRMEETGEVTSREISLSDFAALINDPELHWRDLPYRITVTSNEVTKIEEIYIP